jgi:hypothetical protein
MNRHARNAIAFLISFWLVLLFAPCCVAATVSWVAPTQNCDNSTLDPADITGFTLYYGPESRGYGVMPCDGTDTYTYPNSIEIAADLREYELTPLEPGDWYMTMTASTAQGTSVYSVEVMKTVVAAMFALGPSSQEGATIAGPLEVLIGETGKPVTITWEGGDGEIRIQLVEYGDGVPIVSAQLQASSLSWDFTPNRAGMFDVRFSFDDGATWQLASEAGWLYYFGLAAPSGGGIN